jgi:hypothetical protein
MCWGFTQSRAGGLWPQPGGLVWAHGLVVDMEGARLKVDPRSITPEGGATTDGRSCRMRSRVSITGHVRTVGLERQAPRLYV